ncbi:MULTISPECIES: dsRBD fold-containing protein [Kitasatospora]|uniref:dsRBD fold-containing protein n=1 Tax=Kitasatospora TaxID=2063 RepID=UPI000C6FE9C8|nr:dsRBD fold-containing protein [Kitasatospora sp. GP30]MDH6143697.1 hypothetical protein [Kitasatospora sp. GP30]
MVRTKEWQLRLELTEDGDLTTVHAVLDTGEGVLETISSARRNPLDARVPQIGDEFAAGRALVELGHQLLRAGTAEATGNDPAARE